MAEKGTLNLFLIKCLKISLLLKVLKRNNFNNLLIPLIGGCAGGYAVSNSLWIIFMPLSLTILWTGFDKGFSNFFWGLSFMLASHYWLLYLHPLTWLGFSWIISLFITTIIYFGCAIGGGWLIFLWGYIAQKLINKKYIFSENIIDIFLKILFLCFLWAFGELILSQTSFFWIGIGDSLIPGDFYLAGLARWIGSTGLCVLQLLIGFWIFYLFEKWKRNLQIERSFFFGTISLVVLHLVGAFLTLPKSLDNVYPVFIWQTNIPTREKLLIDNKTMNEKILNIQERALLKNASLLITPEGTLRSDFVFNFPSKINTLAGGFRRFKNQLRSSLLFFEEGEKLFSGFIDKNRLVPIGEKYPKVFNKFKGLSSVGGIQPGPKSRYFALKNLPNFAIAICYEISDGIKIRAAIRSGAEMILTIANLDPYPKKIHDQFISIASMRSIENNRETIIASNTGPSGLIRSDGKIDKLIEKNISDTITVYPNKITKNTFYNNFGLKILTIIFILLIVVNFFISI